MRVQDIMPRRLLRLPDSVALLVLVTLASCAPDPEAARVDSDTTSRRTGAHPVLLYRGRYWYGFETSHFMPCGTPERATGGWDRWWVQPTDATRVALWQRLRELDSGGIDSMLPDRGPVYAEFRGELSAKSSYGHLGVSDRQLLVREVVVLGPMSAYDCR